MCENYGFPVGMDYKHILSVTPSAGQKLAIRLLHACSQSGNISVKFGSLQTCSKRIAIRVSRVSQVSQPSDTNLTSRRGMCDNSHPASDSTLFFVRKLKLVVVLSNGQDPTQLVGNLRSWTMVWPMVWLSIYLPYWRDTLTGAPNVGISAIFSS